MDAAAHAHAGTRAWPNPQNGAPVSPDAPADRAPPPLALSPACPAGPPSPPPPLHLCLLRSTSASSAPPLLARSALLTDGRPPPLSTDGRLAPVH
eukprot:7377330-Prymnesium_polylepis.1